MRVISILDALLWLFSVCLTIYMCYYAGIFLPFALRCRRSFAAHAPAKCRFAVLVAARNEQAVIGHLVESLLAQDYPDDLFDVYVIPNNFTDHTEQAARAAGAQILTCPFPVRSKGDVLRQVVAMLQKQGRHDAICVFDADNVVDPGFLRAMNNAWCAGARAAQGYRDSKNPLDTVISGNYSIYYWMVNRFYSHARSTVGLSAIINGSGFMADLNLLASMGGWNTLTLTEDIEFTTKCILQDVRVEWVPDAITYDEQPLTFVQSWRQRCRWSTGLYQCLSHYCIPLLRGLFSSGIHGFRARLDQLVFLLAPVIQIFWLISLVAGQAMRMCKCITTCSRPRRYSQACFCLSWCPMRSAPPWRSASFFWNASRCLPCCAAYCPTGSFHELVFHQCLLPCPPHNRVESHRPHPQRRTFSNQVASSLCRRRNSRVLRRLLLAAQHTVSNFFAAKKKYLLHQRGIYVIM